MQKKDYQLNEMLVHRIRVYKKDCDSNSVDSTSNDNTTEILPVQKNKQYFRHLVRPSITDILSHVALYVFRNKKLYNLSEFCDNFKIWLQTLNINIEHSAAAAAVNLWDYSILFGKINSVSHPIVNYFNDTVPEYYTLFFTKLIMNPFSLSEDIENHITVINQFVYYTGTINTELLESCMQDHFVYMDSIFMECLKKIEYRNTSQPIVNIDKDNDHRNMHIDLYASSSEMLDESETELESTGDVTSSDDRKEAVQPNTIYEDRLPGRKAYFNQQAIASFKDIPENFDLEAYAKNCIQISAEILGNSKNTQHCIRNEYINFQNYISTTATNDNISHSDKTCSICYEALVSIVIACGHTFCLDCVRGLKRTSTISVKCPTCNESSKFNLCSYLYIV